MCVFNTCGAMLVSFVILRNLVFCFKSVNIGFKTIRDPLKWKQKDWKGHSVTGTGLEYIEVMGAGPLMKRRMSAGLYFRVFGATVVKHMVWDTQACCPKFALRCKGFSDEGQCLLFPYALTGAALNWFYRLKPRMVDSFDELKQILLNHFMIQTGRLYFANDLCTIPQKEDESLREYAADLEYAVGLAMNTRDAQKQMIGQPSAPSRVVFGPRTSSI
ncbi:unnamed protein product [Prunus armeniaca]